MELPRDQSDRRLPPRTRRSSCRNEADGSGCKKLYDTLTGINMGRSKRPKVGSERSSNLYKRPQSGIVSTMKRILFVVLFSSALLFASSWKQIETSIRQSSLKKMKTNPHCSFLRR